MSDFGFIAYLALAGVVITSLALIYVKKPEEACLTIIMAGIRTAAVWTIGIATLSTAVGQTSLGNYIFSGLQTENWVYVLTGCIAVVALAMFVDQVLGMIEAGVVRRDRRRIVAGILALVTLTLLEIVLGVDNVIFISILSSKLPKSQQSRARRTGLLAAMGMRLLLLLSIAWVIRLTAPLFTAFGRPVSGRDLILIVGGLFLLAKATLEIHDKLEGEEGHGSARDAPTLSAMIAQIMVLDIVFSLDSVITAVGMAEDLSIMVAAVVLSVGVMIFSAEPISAFVNRHPTVKVLALSFLLLIGLSLVGDGLGMHVPKGYIYFAMGFSVFVEMVNLRVRGAAAKPVHCISGTSTSETRVGNAANLRSNPAVGRR